MKSAALLMFVILTTACQNQNLTPSKSPHTDSSAIIGGESIDPEHDITTSTVLVSIQFQSMDGTVVAGGKCTGFIVSKFAVATAGHCFLSSTPHSKFRVWISFGYDLSSPNIVKRWAKDIIVHPGFIKNENADDDIAIVTLKETHPTGNRPV